ncbi:MAG: DeoR/GlpR transcriptional regulator [Armatimonadetes bacterium]|nr:DeoR/GlpR transcriptional regulator [Armatimonadota bacterium]
MVDQKRTRQNHLIAAERRRTIYRYAQEQGSVNATEMAEVLGVGISTIRRDLDALHDENKIIRVHGGAVVKETAVPRVPYRQSRDQHGPEKAAIAQAALAYLPESGAVFIGGGTTTYQLAILLPPKTGISVVTNALDIATYLASNDIAPVDFVGGTIRPESLQSNCEESLDSIYWDTTFMGLAALDVHRGITTDNRSAARQEVTIYSHGSRFIALCDSSKIGRFAYARVAPVTAIDILITDSGIDPDILRQLRNLGLDVVVASPVSK